MSIRRMLAALISGALLACFAVFATPVTASAATSGCYGASCNGLDPAGRCDGDAISVASKSVSYGLLELRYSPSCKSNWTRYVPYTRSVAGMNLMTIVSYARVTVWNPGQKSYTVAQSHLYTSSSWSQMTDGTVTACAGVEEYTSGQWVSGSGNTQAPNDWEDKVWNWGPCY